MTELTKLDQQFMRRAIELARMPFGLVSPNPYVGAVIVKNGQIIGEGYHAKAGTSHAEVVAIQNAKESTAGATIYVSLEPCCHSNKTGPCTEAILKAGITKVIYGVRDPNPSVSGKGDAFLLANGIDVVCANSVEASNINEIFFHNQLKKSPFVTLKAALSLDGKIATKIGDSKWITSSEAREKAHKLRLEHDAILIGKKTLLNDNPNLTVRIQNQKVKNPIRLLLLRNFNGIQHTNYHLFETNNAPTWIVYPKNQVINESFKDSLILKNVRLLPIDGLILSMNEVLDKLYKENVMSILLEGGSSIYNAFLSENKVDQLALFYGPRLIGDASAPSLWDKSNIQNLSQAPILEINEMTKFGDSFYVHAKFKGD